jgi:hypothetical protein
VANTCSGQPLKKPSGSKDRLYNSEVEERVDQRWDNCGMQEIESLRHFLMALTLSSSRISGGGHVIDRLKVVPAAHRSCSDVSAAVKTGKMARASLLSTPKL